MRDLFDNVPEPGKSLKIVKPKRKGLSQKQQTFNWLTKQIEKMEAGMVTDEAKLKALLKLYKEELEPAGKQNALNKINLARVLALTGKTYKYGKKQLESLAKTITTLCSQAFTSMEPDGDTIGFFDEWSETTYAEILKSETEDAKDMLADMIYENFGVSVDIGDKWDDPEEIARMAKELQDKMQGQAEEAGEKKKTKKQLEQEALEKKENDTRLKSIKAIYIGLAKVLHPDTETDTTLKAEKEELMKKVTAAYQKNDLPALLKLEMQWVKKENLHPEKLADETLDAYISLLKEQYGLLQHEKSMLYLNPLYMEIQDYMYEGQKQATNMIRFACINLENSNTEIQDTIKEFSGATSKKAVMEFVEAFNDLTDEMEEDDLYDMEW